MSAPETKRVTLTAVELNREIAHVRPVLARKVEGAIARGAGGALATYLVLAEFQHRIRRALIAKGLPEAELRKLEEHAKGTPHATPPPRGVTGWLAKFRQKPD